MKHLIYNINYFIKEVIIIFRTNLFSNIFSLLSTGLIFFVLTLVISGWWVSNHIVEMIQGEAEMSVYLKPNLDEATIIHKLNEIRNIEGIIFARIVDENEAYNRMEQMLGKEARVLSYFDENPFNQFIEAQIDLDKINETILQLEKIDEIDYIRDNQEVLNKLSQITKVLRLLGYLIILAVGIATLVIISHIIRQGIYNNKEHIHTLELLGAPLTFIGFPYVIEGFLLTIIGGGLAFGLSAFVINLIYEQIALPLPFIPLPPKKDLYQNIFFMLFSLSGALGVLGSLFGLASSD